MTIRLNGSTSGYAQLDSAAVGGNNTLVLPTTNGTANQALVTDGSGTLSFADRGRMTLATAQNSTSGTSIDFTGIPSWVKRITVMFAGVSTNGASQLIFQLGTSSGVETSSYTGAGAYGSALATANSSGFLFADTSSANSSYARDGLFTFCNLTSNTWVMSGVAAGATSLFETAGSKSLSATLSRIRITTVNGTDTFDAGSINILYEG